MKKATISVLVTINPVYFWKNVLSICIYMIITCLNLPKHWWIFRLKLNLWTYILFCTITSKTLTISIQTYFWVDWVLLCLFAHYELILSLLSYHHCFYFKICKKQLACFLIWTFRKFIAGSWCMHNCIPDLWSIFCKNEKNFIAE